MLSTLLNPEHQHNTRTPDEYLAAQRAVLKKNREAYPLKAALYPEPWPSLDVVTPYVSGGCWVVKCRCMNAPSVHPMWRLACCFECGAVYREIALPEGWREIERLLTQRPQLRQMNWRAPETIADLIAENLAHGDPA